MEQITFEIDNKKDANLLVAIAEKLGIKKYTILKGSKQRVDKSKAHHIPSIVNEMGNESKKEEVTKEKNYDISLMTEADSTIDISSLTKIFTNRNLDSDHIRKTLWQREG